MNDYLDDIPQSLSHAYNWTSQDPEGRFRRAREDYASTLATDLATLEAEARKGKTEHLLPDEFARYREGLRKRWVAAIASDSRCASSFITGPSNFPAERMQKRNDIASRRWNEAIEWHKRALAAVIRTLRPDLAPIMSSDSDALARIDEKLASYRRTQEQMRDVNKVIRKHATATREERKAAVGRPFDYDALANALRSLGYLTEQSIAKLLRPNYLGDIGFEPWQLSNNLAEIRRLEKRREQIATAQSTPDTAIDGQNARLEDCPSENRVRLFFPGKPAEDVRSNLKRHGFRWAPSIGAWQAYRNPNALHFARQFAGVTP